MLYFKFKKNTTTTTTTRLSLLVGPSVVPTSIYTYSRYLRITRDGPTSPVGVYPGRAIQSHKPKTYCSIHI